MPAGKTPEEKPKAEGERLQVVLARSGLASRRGVVTLIEAGKVTVNGKPALEKGLRVDPSKDQISVEGTPLTLQTDRKSCYFAFNKPKGVMTTMQDPNAERAVADFFRDIPARVFPVGRLDRDTTGLILMTDDGELAFRLTHPRFGVKKLYRARVRGSLEPQTIKTLESGVDLEEGRTAPCQIRIEAARKTETIVSITLHEGKKRQIRRIFAGVGHPVIELERLAYGPLELGSLMPGERRALYPDEVKALQAAAGLKGTKPKKGGA